MSSEPQIAGTQEKIQIGLKHLQAGRLNEAEYQFRQVLEADSNHPDALYLLGVVAYQVGNIDLSVRFLAKAVDRRPSSPQFLNDLGRVNHALQRMEEALDNYDKALAIKPDFAEAWFNRGNAMQHLKRHDEAVSSYDRALVSNPCHVEALSNRGVALRHLKRHDEALASYDRALAIEPDYAEALCNRGNALQELERHGDAVASYDQALAIRPDFVEALCSRGNALRKLKRYEEAFASYDEAVRIDSQHVEAFNNRGTALQDLRRYDDALASYESALAIKPDFAEAMFNRGHALQKLKRYDEALASYDEALRTQPDYVEALFSRGHALRELGRYGEALASFDRAVALKPDHASAHFDASLCRLLMGDFERGWKQYEWRWKCADVPALPRNFPQPLWLGEEDLAGRTILLHAEQGLGDTIQFSRYARKVAEKGAKVVLEVQPQIATLLSSESVVHQVLRQGEPLPAFDYHCPLLSLPLAFRTVLDTVPAQVPYLKVSATAALAWRKKLTVKGTRLVGLCWRGNPRYTSDSARSLKLEELRPLLACPGMRFVSLQKDLSEEESAIVAKCENFIHPGSDFTGTAEMVGALDLVISVDTAWAHWAGAIGKPLWVLLSTAPHWCWLLERKDSPWYPTARIFRQTQPGNWKNVVHDVKREISSTF